MKIVFRILGIYLNVLSYLSPKLAGKQGFRIFCYPHRIKLNKTQVSFLRQAIHNEVILEKYKSFVYKWGKGPKKILLLHGWQSNSFRWKRYMAHFDLEKYTFYAFDAPAHGLSPGNMLNLVVYGKMLNKVLKELPQIDVIIGHSMGAFASLYNYYEFVNPPLEKLILLGTPGEVSDFVDLYQQMLGLNDKVFRYISEYFINQYGYTLKYFSAKKFATKMKMKGLIIHDEADQAAPFKHALAIHANWELSKMIATTGMGHKLNKPEIIRDLISFLESKDHLALRLLDSKSAKLKFQF